ncbi:MAG TPA: hypothetical protein VGJ32_06395, partial [Solirubrobacteraceae bacterium]
MAADPTTITPRAPRTETPVFVDPAGRRARGLRAAAAVGALAGLLVLGALVLGALGVGGLPGVSTIFGDGGARQGSVAPERPGPATPGAAP